MIFVILTFVLISVHLMARRWLRKQVRLRIDFVMVLIFLWSLLNFVLPGLGVRLLTSFFLGPNAVAH